MHRTSDEAEQDITTAAKNRPPPLNPFSWNAGDGASNWGAFKRSPSSPDLLRGFADKNQLGSLPVPATPTLTRSRTMPRLRSKGEMDLLSEGQPNALEHEKVQTMRRWVLCIAVVNFDLDLGPILDTVYPRVRFTATERQNIAFSSFPDSALVEPGSHMHSFRIHDSAAVHPPITPSDLEPRPHSLDGFLYGFSCFTQKRDASSKRGYLQFQRSIVFLSHHPFPALFSDVCSKLGPLYLKHGITMLEAACQNISNWPEPVPGSTCELGFLGSVLDVELPSASDEQQFTHASSRRIPGQAIQILASLLPPIPPTVVLFSSCLPSLWSIWECLVLQEPVLVFSPSPTITSQAVWWLRDLLRPLSASGDYRPYFTIHDQDFGVFIHKNQPPAGVILGVTNPFFENACKHWPHAISLHAPSSTEIPLKKGVAPVLGPTPGFRTSHNRYISKDRALMKQLQDSLQQGIDKKIDVSLALRQHFAARTTSLLVPLNRYLTSLIPPPNPNLSIKAPRQRLKAFNRTDFLASLKTHGSPLPFRAGKQKAFYERWLKTNAFGSWLVKQEQAVNEVLLKSSPRI